MNAVRDLPDDADPVGPVQSMANTATVVGSRPTSPINEDDLQLYMQTHQPIPSLSGHDDDRDRDSPDRDSHDRISEASVSVP